MDRKNLALEALRNLLTDGIRSRSKSNVVQTKAFSVRLEDAVARYHANAITTAEVLQELIRLAKDIRAARQRGEESGLTDEEIAFYDALAENNSAVEAMGDAKLRLIAHELLNSLKENVSVDWAHRESSRARMRVLVKRILRKYGYPPDLQDAAVQTVLQQAEQLLSGPQGRHLANTSATFRGTSARRWTKRRSTSGPSMLSWPSTTNTCGTGTARATQMTAGLSRPALKTLLMKLSSTQNRGPSARRAKPFQSPKIQAPGGTDTWSPRHSRSGRCRPVPS